MNRRKLILLSAIGMAMVWGMPAMAQERGGRPDALASAQPGDLRMFVSGAMRGPISAVQPQLEALTGHKLVMDAGESRMLQERIIAGQAFEVATITGAVIDDMIAKGKIVPGSRVDLGVVRVGVAVRGDAPKLDFSTAAGTKAALMGAAHVSRFYGVGASVPTMDNLFTKLGITDAIKDKVIPLGVPRTGPAPEPIKAGEYELIVNLASEVIPMKGWTYLGLIPEEFQIPVQLSAGVGVAGDKDAAAKVIAFLKGPGFDKALSDHAMTRK